MLAPHLWHFQLPDVQAEWLAIVNLWEKILNYLNCHIFLLYWFKSYIIYWFEERKCDVYIQHHLPLGVGKVKIQDTYFFSYIDFVASRGICVPQMYRVQN